jgi:hypothetical protein
LVIVFRLERLNEDVFVSENVWKIYTVSYMHYSTIGTLVGIAVGLVVSLLSPTEQKLDPKLVTPFIRKFVYPSHSTSQNSKETNIEEQEMENTKC